MKILAISGSLRAASINSAFCRAAARLAPSPLEITVYSGIGNLPLFSPDLETSLPAAVNHFRAAVAQAQALIIASPEYAHGISGPMKNTLDWLVSFEGFIGKPVALVNTSPRARHAYEATVETLKTMSARVLDGPAFTIPLLANCTTEEAMLASPEVSHQICQMLASLVSSFDVCS
jgi:chromate reductase